jgi:predicted alpha/beta superfamily hydrolase
MKDKQTIHSVLLEEERPYWVHLPVSYGKDPNQRYPVVVILDGETNGRWVPGILDFMATRYRMPEVIALGIYSSDPAYDLPTDARVRDSTPTNSVIEYDGTIQEVYRPSGGADRFLRFVGEELMPMIDGRYRTEPRRVMVGHSLMGTLVTHAFLTSNPHFQAYVAVDACFWWDNQLAWRMLRDLPDTSPAFACSLFIVCGGCIPSAVKAQEDFFTLLMERVPEELRANFFFRRYPEETHGSCYLKGIYDGLTYTIGRRDMILKGT